MDWKDIAPPRASQGDFSLPYGYAEVGTAALCMKRQLEFQVLGLSSLTEGAPCKPRRCQEVCLRMTSIIRCDVYGTHYHVIFTVMVIPTRIVGEHMMISISSTLTALFWSIIEDNGNIGTNFKTILVLTYSYFPRCFLKSHSATYIPLKS